MVKMHSVQKVQGRVRVVHFLRKRRLKNTELLSRKNKTRTSKVGAISKAQKAQNIFSGKKT